MDEAKVKPAPVGKFSRFFLTIPKEETVRRARLLNAATLILSILAVMTGISSVAAEVLRVSAVDWAGSVAILSALAVTAVLTFAAQSRRKYEAATLIFIFGFVVSVSIAVWQFGSRVPEVHLGYLIPVALAATLWGSIPGSLTALLVWAANVWVVRSYPGSDSASYGAEQVIGLLSMGVAYFALALVVGRYAENLANALGRAEQKAREAAEAEKQARVYAEDLASSLHAEQARRRDLATLYALASRLAATSKLQEFLPFMTESIIASLRVSFAAVALVEEKGAEEAPFLVLAASYPLDSVGWGIQIGRKVSLSHLPTVARAIECRECLVVLRDQDFSLDEVETEFLATTNLSALVICPIFSEDKPLGTLILGESRAWDVEPVSGDKTQLARSIADLAAGAIQRSKLLDELEEAYVQTVLALAKAVEAKDTYTADHAERLAELAERVARRLGLTSPVELQALRFGAMLHDVGKIGVPDSVLKKPGQLDPDEWNLMKQHPVIGSRILETLARLREAGRIVRHHHERWDGKGYPDGLVAEAIPLGARILTVVDSYSAIVDQRAYKPARSRSEAIAELQRCAGSQFDRHVVDAFLEVLEEEATRTDTTTQPETSSFPQPAA